MNEFKTKETPVKYNFTYLHCGRIYPQPYHASISVFKKIVRHTVCYGVYVDIDIENCHPVLLL